MKVTTPDGRIVDTLTVATDDMLMTAMARCDLWCADDLGWLRDRMIEHAQECGRSDDKAAADAECYLAIARFLERRMAE